MNLSHHTTPEYQEALRKSGDKHGVSGLSATEQKARAAVRKSKFDMQTAKALAKRLNNRPLTLQSCQQWQRTLLAAYWGGWLQERSNAATSRYQGDTMCRTPSVALTYFERAVIDGRAESPTDWKAELMPRPFVPPVPNKQR